MFTRYVNRAICVLLLQFLLPSGGSDQLEKMIEFAKKIRVYVSADFRQQVLAQHLTAGHFEKLTSNESDILRPLVDWLYVHDEYQFHNYMELRLVQDRRLYVDDISTAHLCYPSCSPRGELTGPRAWSGGSPQQHISFEVINPIFRFKGNVLCLYIVSI